jgi:hypothetical protein
MLKLYIERYNRMNRANNSTQSSGAGGFKMVIGVIVFILIIVGLYYIYDFLYGSTLAKSSVSILSGTPPASKASVNVSSAVGTGQAVSMTNLTGILDGGEYSASMWVYISDTKGFNAPGGAPLAHLLEISNSRFSDTAKGNTLVFIGLNPTNGSLIVRQSSSDPTEVIDNSMAPSSGTTSTKYPLQNLVDNYSTDTKFKGSDDRCDILNGIEYQRWILVTVVGNGRTLDVYIDGKLARSCIYKGSFALGSTSGTGQAIVGYNNQGKLKGFFSKGDFYNYALTPDQVWANYQAGPGSSFNLTEFFNSLFSVNIAFKPSSELNA